MTEAQSHSPRRRFPSEGIPRRAGIGLRHAHIDDMLETRPAIGWLEVHSENFVKVGGPRRASLERLRERYPLSCHGVALSLGSADGLDPDHLKALRALFDWIEPGLVSEHVAWSVNDGTYLNDLLPLPYTDEALTVLCRNVETAQEAFGRQILVENPSSYVTFESSTMAEWEFMAEVAARTGCGLLLDVNNIHVSAHNHAFDAARYLDHVPLDKVREVHLAGHFIQQFDEGTILIDDHGAPVADAVWALFREALARLGPVPTLIEWDTKLPELPVLLNEARKAQLMLDHADANHPDGGRHVA